jgi:cobalt-zinc-cadmium efflux system outer membrane protein
MTAENFAGSGRYDVWTQSEITASYGHTLERGGKREARIALAEKDVGVAAATAQVMRLNLAEQVERAYYDVVIADEVASAAEQRPRLAGAIAPGAGLHALEWASVFERDR